MWSCDHVIMSIALYLRLYMLLILYMHALGVAMVGPRWRRRKFAPYAPPKGRNDCCFCKLLRSGTLIHCCGLGVASPCPWCWGDFDERARLLGEWPPVHWSRQGHRMVPMQLPKAFKQILSLRVTPTNWHSIWHILTFYLAFCLKCMLAFFCILPNIFYLTFTWLLSDIYLGIPSNILPVILSDVSSDILSGTWAGILTGMFSDLPSGILSDLSYGIPPDILPDILSVFFWHSIWVWDSKRIQAAYYLTFHMAFYVTFDLACYLAFHLGLYLTLISGILSGILFGIHSDIHLAFYSIYSYIYIWNFRYTDLRILSCILSGILFDK